MFKLDFALNKQLHFLKMSVRHLKTIKISTFC